MTTIDRYRPEPIGWQPAMIALEEFFKFIDDAALYPAGVWPRVAAPVGRRGG
ncbi:hypothetical protein [Kitasatospora aureofaciens]|uniref:hypothetical protein n=1 Tax=Kitasatospora aureofaciens TaxID=1894 RepID=UPI003826D058